MIVMEFFPVRVINSWNSLPDNIVSSSYVWASKLALVNYIFVVIVLVNLV